MPTAKFHKGDMVRLNVSKEELVECFAKRLKIVELTYREMDYFIELAKLVQENRVGVIFDVKQYDEMLCYMINFNSIKSVLIPEKFLIKETSKIGGDNMEFDDFIVVEHKSNFYGIYENMLGPIGNLITSAKTEKEAIEKARLLQKGYNIGKNKDYKNI